MPEKKTIARAKRDLEEGKSASTAAGEFVREEIEHIREGKHGARSTEQAIAIGLSKARRAGVPLRAPARGTTSEKTRRSAERDAEVGRGTRKPRPSTKRRRATTRALKREPRAAASKAALSRHAKAAAPRRRAKAATARGNGSAAKRASGSTKRPARSSASRSASSGSRARPKSARPRRPRHVEASA